MGEVAAAADRPPDAAPALHLAADAPEVQAAILDALDGAGADAVAAWRPVRDDAGDVVDFELVAATRNCVAMLGPLGSRLAQSLPPELSDSVTAIRRAFETGLPVTQEMAFVGPDGQRWGEAVRVPSRGLVVVHWRDQTQLQAARSELQARERRFRALVEHNQDSILVLDPDRKVAYVSPAVRQIFGVDPERMLGMSWGAFAHPDDHDTVQGVVDRAGTAPEGATNTVRARARTADGRLLWLEIRATNHMTTPGVGGVIVNVRNVTEQCDAEEALRRLAMSDALTGLPNRRAFLEEARHALGRVERWGAPVALLLLDLDDFKVVNDSLGHPVGDRLLVQVAERLLAAVRPGDTVARLGGDEFVVIAEGLSRDEDAVLVAERLLAQASGVYDLGNGLRSRVSLSIGLCTGWAQADADQLLAHADAALYEAKRRGRGRVEVFDPELRQRVVDRLHLEHELHAALTRNELVLHWQPILRVDGPPGAGCTSVVAVEALVRWQHPDRGLLLPGSFLPVAEQAGLMREVCDWVADRALAQAAAWSGLPRAPRVFVNLSADEVAAPGLASRWAAVANRHGVEPARVTAELSERLLPDDVAVVRQSLEGLRERGFQVALDDFGAGNTALAWLQQLPLDLLKLDRRFVAGLGDPSTQAIVQALIELAPALGLDTVAEGVETAEQLSALVGLGCGLVQGYHLGRPEPAERVRDLLVASPGSRSGQPGSAQRQPARAYCGGQ